VGGKSRCRDLVRVAAWAALNAGGHHANGDYSFDVRVFDSEETL